MHSIKWQVQLNGRNNVLFRVLFLHAIVTEQKRNIMTAHEKPEDRKEGYRSRKLQGAP